MRSRTTRRDFLRMMGAAAGVAVGATLPGIPQTAFSATSPSTAPPEKRPLGKTGFQVGTIGFGAMTTRDPEVIRFAVDRGVDYVDTAARYMGGENERIVGRALAGIRDKVILATKAKIGTVDEMILSAENSLRSLKTDVIDLLQLHNVTTEEEVTDGRVREAFQKLIDQGKVRAVGVTTHSGQETVLRAVAKHGFYKTVLVAYNFRSETGFASKRKGDLEMTPGLSNTIREVAAAGYRHHRDENPGRGVRVPPGGIQPVPGGARVGPRQPRRDHGDPGDDELRPGRGEPRGARQDGSRSPTGSLSAGTRSRSGIVIAACAARAAASARTASRSRTCCGR